MYDLSLTDRIYLCYSKGNTITSCNFLNWTPSSFVQKKERNVITITDNGSITAGTFTNFTHYQGKK